MNIKRYEVRGGRSGLEEAGGPTKKDRQVVLISDHIDSHAYDESKERELFISEFKLEGKIYYDENTNQWLPTSDTIKGFQMAERTLGCWLGWSACAKSRARSAE